MYHKMNQKSWQCHYIYATLLLNLWEHGPCMLQHRHFFIHTSPTLRTFRLFHGLRLLVKAGWGQVKDFWELVGVHVCYVWYPCRELGYYPWGNQGKSSLDPLTYSPPTKNHKHRGGGPTPTNPPKKKQLSKPQKRQACQSFLPSLAWSMVLLGVFMFMGSLIMGNLLQVCAKDDGDEMLTTTGCFFFGGGTETSINRWRELFVGKGGGGWGWVRPKPYLCVEAVVTWRCCIFVDAF